MPLTLRHAAPAALLLIAALPMAGQTLRNGVPADQIVVIRGQFNGRSSKWSSYQNGTFTAETTEAFRIPSQKTLVVVEADLTIAGDRRKIINADFVLKDGKYPLARMAFKNEGGHAYFTATRTFALGLVVPQTSPSGQEALLSLNVFEPQGSARYEVTLHGYYAQ